MRTIFFKLNQDRFTKYKKDHMNMVFFVGKFYILLGDKNII